MQLGMLEQQTVYLWLLHIQYHLVQGQDIPDLHPQVQFDTAGVGSELLF